MHRDWLPPPQFGMGPRLRLRSCLARHFIHHNQNSDEGEQAGKGKQYPQNCSQSRPLMRQWSAVLRDAFSGQFFWNVFMR